MEENQKSKKGSTGEYGEEYCVCRGRLLGLGKRGKSDQNLGAERRGPQSWDPDLRGHR